MLKKTITILLEDMAALLYFVIKIIFIDLFDRHRKYGFRILVYHSVSSEKDIGENNVSLVTFKKQMAFLKNAASIKKVSLAEGVEALKGSRLYSDLIAITFDDGLSSVYGGAVETLERFDLPATFFIIGENIDNNTQADKKFMDLKTVLTLQEKGFEISCHSYLHKRLSLLTSENLEKEVRYSKKIFEGLGIAVKYFAYPYGFYGDFSKNTASAVRNAGYEACFTDIFGINMPGDSLLELKRTRISWRDSRWRFKMKIYGAYDWIDAVKHWMSWNKSHELC